MNRFLLSTMAVLISAQSLFALTGREIMDRNDALPEPETGVSSVSMKIKKGGREMDKEFIMSMKKLAKNEERILIEFTVPTKIKLLTHTHKRSDDDQWLSLSSGRVKRIAAADKDKPFVNSHFFYEDMESRDIDDYDYRYIGDGKGAGEDCHMVEAVRKRGGAKVYDKTVLYARKSDFFIVRIDFYRGGGMIKYLENYDIKKISGILTPMKVVMMQPDNRGGTLLRVNDVKYNRPLRESIFNKENLR